MTADGHKPTHANLLLGYFQMNSAWSGYLAKIERKVYMIAFRDFRSSRTGSPLSGGIDSAIASANEWLQEAGIRPLNIETLSDVRGTLGAHKVERGLRVWYEIGTLSR